MFCNWLLVWVVSYIFELLGISTGLDLRLSLGCACCACCGLNDWLLVTFVVCFDCFDCLLFKVCLTVVCLCWFGTNSFGCCCLVLVACFTGVMLLVVFLFDIGCCSGNSVVDICSLGCLAPLVINKFILDCVFVLC